MCIPAHRRKGQTEVIEPVKTRSLSSISPSISASAAAHEKDAHAFDAQAQPRLTKADLKPGTILQTISDNRTLRRLLIRCAQSMPNANSSISRMGNPTRVHTAMWTQTPGNPKRGSQFGPGEPEIVEAVKDYKVRGNALNVDSYDVWEPKDETLGCFAAQNSLMAAENMEISYSQVGAAGTMLASAAFTDSAQDKLDQYTKDAFTTDQSWARNGSFCAQFVVTSYQGAHQHVHPGTELPGALRTDPRYTSPCRLDHMLRTHPEDFVYRGVLHITPQDVAYPQEQSPSRE